MTGRAGAARRLASWINDPEGTRKEVEYAFKILEQGTSADRQLAMFQQTGDLKSVVDMLVRETAEGVL